MDRNRLLLRCRAGAISRIHARWRRYILINFDDMDVFGRHSRLTRGMREPVTVQIIGRHPRRAELFSASFIGWIVNVLTLREREKLERSRLTSEFLNV